MIYETEEDRARELLIGKAAARHLSADKLTRMPRRCRWDFIVAIGDQSIRLETKHRHQHYENYKISKSKVDEMRDGCQLPMLAVRTPELCGIVKLNQEFPEGIIYRRDRPSQPEEPAYVIEWDLFEPMEPFDPFEPQPGSVMTVTLRQDGREVIVSVPYRSHDDLDKLLQLAKERFQ